MKKSEMTRRQMMAQSAGLLATVALAGRSVGQADTQAAKNGFKIGACDWTLGKQANPEAFAVAKRIGIDGVQLSLNTLNKPVFLQNPQVREKFLIAAKENQMQISSIAIGELNEVPLKGDDPRAEQWVAESIDVCKVMGVNVVLVAFFGKGELLGDQKGQDVVVEKIKRIAPKAQEAGVRLALESYLSAEQYLEVIERIGSPAVRVYYDVANATDKGYDILKEIRTLGDKIVEFHAKDHVDLYGKGSIDFPAVRKAMDDIAYRGWFVMEGTKTPLGLEESLRYDAEYLRKVFPLSV